MSSDRQYTVLHNGVNMPWVGLGVFQAKDGQQVCDAVLEAISAGYRSVDTAAAYNNETGVGLAVQQAPVPREELFITTKVWNTNQGYDQTLKAFAESRERLGLSVVDLYLIHWPVANKYKDTWRALESLYQAGEVRAIGVSNFHIHHLEDLLQEAKVKPMVNQVEYHPWLAQRDLQQFCKQLGIQLEAWSPLRQGRVDDPVVARIAAKHNKTPAQVILRWDLENKVVTIPKSVTPKRIHENIDVFDFSLTPADMEDLARLDCGGRTGPDPDNFNF